MKTLIISSLIAVSSIFTFVTPSYAETVTVTTTERVIRKPVREEYRPRHHQRASRDCFVKKVRTNYHGRVVVKKTRICR
ncbi:MULTISPECIES: hypothetical protein [unclassified Rhizobium]|uniref:hypothetical protein n=1 Tax=unclassified Rhizobium TaxID=2613769 RepID=UPI00178460BB|nr:MULTISPECIES: hypothetical protein [unclassified Rhizobium]MBD8686677.1 hypothetical protein [Rhizobium sp. CFBP 13644]MBD8691521.1 hypothetical protein [Rhizobium sp. CFBP 13717]